MTDSGPPESTPDDGQEDTRPLDTRSELARLRAEVARLEQEVGEAAPAGDASRDAPPSSGSSGQSHGWWRGLIVIVCLSLMAVIAPIAVVATWAHDEVSDTERFVATMAPLAKNPAVQDAVSQRITDEITTRINVRAVTQEAVDALAERGIPAGVAASLSALGTPLANGVENFVSEQVGRLIRSPQFAAAWEEANRQAHGQMVAVLTGDTTSTVQVQGNAVTINLATIIEAVKARLIDAGFTLAERIPSVTAEFTIFESADLAKAQTGFRLLSAAARALPIIALLLLGIAVFASRRRRRTLMIGSLVVAGSMLVLGLALNGFRIVYLDAIPTDRLPADAAGAIYDDLVWFIRLNLRAVLVLFLAIAVTAWVTGPEPAPTTLRRGVTRGLDAVRHRSDRAGLDTGPVGEFLGRYRTAIRGAVAVGVILFYVMAAHPTGGYTLTLLIVAGLVLLVVELLARTPAESRAAPGTAADVAGPGSPGG